MKKNPGFQWAAAISLLILWLHPSSLVAQPASTSGQVLARVNGTSISDEDLAWETGQLKAEMIRRNTPLTDTQLSALQPQLMENLIERELLFQDARQRKIRASDKWVDAALADLKGQLERVSSLQKYLADSGMTLPQLKSRLAKGVVVERLLRQEIVRTIEVSEAEMRAFYRDHPGLFAVGDRIRARQILIAPRGATEAAREEALQKIQALQKRIEEGEDFATLALMYSDGPSRAYAGDIGYLTRDELVAPFADAAFALAPGQVSGVVETRFGYHLIKLLERIPADPPNFWEAQGEIARILRREKETVIINNYVASLKKKAAIELLRAPL